MAKSWYGGGGALVTDQPIEGITQKLPEEHAKFYGGPFFIGETISLGAARKISELLGLEFQEPK